MMLRACLALTLAVLAVAPLSAAARSPLKMLKKIDKANNPFSTRVFTMKMEIKEPDGATRTNEMRIGERGHGRQRLINYKGPADVKGMGVLIQERNELYTYLPSYNRVRRVAMHARKQAFMGSDFTLDDSAQLNFAPDYEPKLLSDEGGKVALELTPRPGKELAYTKLIVTADTKTWLAEKIEYFDDGKLVKTETRWNPKEFGGKLMQMRVLMVDERTKHQTSVEVNDVEVEVSLPKSKFTKRGLIRGDL